MSSVQVSKRPDGVAVISFNAPESAVNVLSPESLSDFKRALDEVINDRQVHGCVLTSTKADCFIAGADLGILGSIKTAAEAEAFSQSGSAVLSRMAAAPIAFVAAIHGSTLGGGLEVALACDSRVATDDPKTVFALPEVQLGLLPGAGGTQRLPRLIGLRSALPLILSGSRVRAKKALQLGLIQKLATHDELLEVAAKEALKGKPNLRPPLLDRVLMLPPARGFILKQARKQVLSKTRGLYPAPLAILDSVKTGLSRGIAEGLRVESEYFGKLVASPEAKSLIWIFHASRELKKLPRESAKPHPVKKLAVLGAGLMGEGIAAVSLPLNPVVLRDISDKTLERTRGNIKSELLPRLETTMEVAKLAGSELVIEAVFEDLPLKQKVLREVEAVISPDAVFATNTSALPISKIGAESRHPERILGMHYFSPVPKMPLLEIIVTPKTADWALATAQAYGIAQGKTVIVVKDGPGFYTTRILVPLLNESVKLLEEGASVELIDRAMKDFGFPVGPLALLDEVGIDVGAHVSADLGSSSNALTRMNQAGYKGRKAKKGFYVYDDANKKGKKQVDASIYEFFGGAPRKQFDPREIAERIAFVFMNEAVLCLQENVIRSARDGDIGAVFGLGFPPFRGGPFHYLDSLGADNAVNKMNALKTKHGERFEPAALLRELADRGGKFFPA